MGRGELFPEWGPQCWGWGAGGAGKGGSQLDHITPDAPTGKFLWSERRILPFGESPALAVGSPELAPFAPSPTFTALGSCYLCALPKANNPTHPAPAAPEQLPFQ